MPEPHLPPHLPPSTAPPAVVVAGLSRHFGEVAAVTDVSFRVHPGEVYGLLGPNGAGKTTTLRVLATLLQPTAGEVTVGGACVRRDPLGVRQRLGYLTGDTGLYGRLTPTEVLRYFGQLHGLPERVIRDRTDRLFSWLGVDRYRDRRCAKLSTGEKQRVSIARALVHDPPVLVLDEPTSGLDIVVAETILDLFRTERARGKAIVFSTHIMAEAELLCDRIGVIHRGRLVAEGSLASVMAETHAPTLTAAFLHLVRHADAAAAFDRGTEVRP